MGWRGKDKYNKFFCKKLGLTYNISDKQNEYKYQLKVPITEMELTIEDIVMLSKTEPLIIEWNSITIYNDYIE